MGNETNPAAALSYKQAQTADADAGLVALSRRGDLDAFEQLVAKHQKKMVNIACRVIGDYDEACEAVQDAFVAAYKNIGSFRGDAKFTTWMTTITLNHARNRLKQIASRRARIAVSLDQPTMTDDGAIRPDAPSNEPSVLEKLEARDVGIKVRRCVEALEPEYREVIVLRDLQDFSYEEICDALKARAGTVKSRLFRAREAIKDCLKKSLEIL